jgi:hypothetical protein
MNGKKAKMLRRVAKNLFKPEEQRKAYQWLKRDYKEKKL